MRSILIKLFLIIFLIFCVCKVSIIKLVVVLLSMIKKVFVGIINKCIVVKLIIIKSVV